MTYSATVATTPLYHYTAPAHLPRIVRAGMLTLTESNVNPSLPHAGRDVLWLTTDSNARASHGLSLGINVRGSVADKTRVRFTLDVPDAVPWLESDEYAAMDHTFRAGIIKSGGGMSAARTWYVAYSPVPRSRWLSVHADGKPVPLEGSAFGADQLSAFVKKWSAVGFAR